MAFLGLDHLESLTESERPTLLFCFLLGGHTRNFPAHEWSQGPQQPEARVLQMDHRVAVLNHARKRTSGAHLERRLRPLPHILVIPVRRRGRVPPRQG